MVCYNRSEQIGIASVTVSCSAMLKVYREVISQQAYHTGQDLLNQGLQKRVRGKSDVHNYAIKPYLLTT